MWATENMKLKAWHTPHGHARKGEVYGTPTFEYIMTLSDSSTFHLNQASTRSPNNEKSFGHIKTKFVFRRESFAYCCFSTLLLLLENLQCSSCSIHFQWMVTGKKFPCKTTSFSVQTRVEYTPTAICYSCSFQLSFSPFCCFFSSPKKVVVMIRHASVLYNCVAPFPSLKKWIWGILKYLK